MGNTLTLFLDVVIACLTVRFGFIQKASSISTLTINKRYQISYTNRETQSAQQIDRLSKRCFGFRTSKSLSKCNAPFGLKRTSPILASVGVNSKIYRSSPAIGTLLVLELAAAVMWLE